MYVLTSLAIATLLIFLFVPSRYLNSGHWGGALLLYAFVEGGTTTAWKQEISFWIAFLGGVGLLVYWLLARLKQLDDTKRPPESDEAADR